MSIQLTGNNMNSSPELSLSGGISSPLSGVRSEGEAPERGTRPRCRGLTVNVRTRCPG